MKYDEIVFKVKAFMDEVGSIDGALVVDNDTEKPVDMIIAETLASAWKSFVHLCPLHLLPTKPMVTTGITIGSNLIAIISKPTDFIRLVSFKLSSWAREVSDPYPAAGNVYAQQNNEFTRGTPTRPVVIIKPAILEGYTAKATSDTIAISYVAEVVFDSTSAEELVPNNIGEAFCYHVAGNVYDILGINVAPKMYANRDALCV